MSPSTHNNWKMLKKFLLNTLSSFVGAWIALAVFGVVAVIVVVGMIARIGSSEPSEEVKKHSVLKLELAGEIVETDKAVVPDYRQLMSGKFDQPLSLSSLVKAINEGADNKHIEALYLDINGIGASPATLDALRAALLDFRKSGKKIYAYADGYSTGDYYVATVADSIFANPDGMINLTGPGSVSFYFKSLLDKVGVQMQIVKIGTFKSAVEPYIMDEMSQPARAQLDTLFGNMWSYLRDEMCQQRKALTPAKIDSLIVRDNINFAPMEKVEQVKLVDKLAYRREMDGKFANLVGVDEDDLNYVSASTLLQQTDWGSAYVSKKQVAVLYATGEIAEGSPDGINCETLVPEIIKLADDDNVKAMVLRVNSPGGSVFGSAQIADALAYFQKKGKPLAVSMGDYAASGGYWISCCSDRIFADPLTITGSIGIFGMFPTCEELANKLGVYPQVVSATPSATFPSLFKKMDENQMAVLQDYIDRGYDSFIIRVATGRKMSKQQVERIAEGRVWDGMTAQKLGLVDQLGGIDDAVKWVAAKAKLDDNYDACIYPQYEPNFWSMLPSQIGANSRTILISRLLGVDDDLATARMIATLLGQNPIQARMPMFDVRFN